VTREGIDEVSVKTTLVFRYFLYAQLPFLFDAHAQVVTFDEGGVSGHPNHMALARAVSSLVRPTGEEIPLPPAVKIWALETTNIIRKYVGPLDILASVLVWLWLWLSESVRRRTGATDYEGNSRSINDFRLCLNVSPGLTFRAMLAYASQFVWYRRLFIVFSRYTYVNTLRELREAGAHMGKLGSNLVTGKEEKRKKR
jgi:N-acetylglucosaminylphosphatidylinositol deacetylase